MVRRPAGRTSSDVAGSRHCREAVPRRPGQSLRPSPGSGPPTSPPSSAVRSRASEGRVDDGTLVGPQRGLPGGDGQCRGCPHHPRCTWSAAPPRGRWCGPHQRMPVQRRGRGIHGSRSAGGGRVPDSRAVPGAPRSLVAHATLVRAGTHRGMRVTMDHRQGVQLEGDHTRVGSSVRPHHAAGAREDVEGRAGEQPAARPGRQVCHMDGCAELGHCDRRGRRSRTACGNPYRRQDVAGHGPRGTTRAGASITGALNGGHVRRRPRRGDLNLPPTASQTPGGDIAAPSGLNACSLSFLRLAYSIRSASSSGFERK